MTVSKNPTIAFICFLIGSLALTLILAGLKMISPQTLGVVITVHIVIYATSLVLVFSRRVTGPIPDLICRQLAGVNRENHPPRHRS